MSPFADFDEMIKDWPKNFGISGPGMNQDNRGVKRMKNKFSPGPWSLDRGQIRDKSGWSLASVPYTFGGPEDHENGVLMAAAPELLSALKQLVGRAEEALNRLDPDNAGMWNAITVESKALIERLEGNHREMENKS